MATYTGTPKTWAVDETLLASDFNAEIRDPIAALSGAWNTYTPTLTQTSAVTKTVSRAAYLRIGKLVIVNVALTATGAGGGNTTITVSLPVTAVASGVYVGSGLVVDASTGSYTCTVSLASTTTAQFHKDSTAAVGASPAFTLANTDELHFTIVYEAA